MRSGKVTDIGGAGVARQGAGQLGPAGSRGCTASLCPGGIGRTGAGGGISRRGDGGSCVTGGGVLSLRGDGGGRGVRGVSGGVGARGDGAALRRGRPGARASGSSGSSGSSGTFRGAPSAARAAAAAVATAVAALLALLGIALFSGAVTAMADVTPVTFRCLEDSASRFGVPLSLMMVVMDTESGRVGAASVNRDGSRDLGPMQVNTWWIPRLTRMGLTEDRTELTEEKVRDDGCVNVAVGAWILRSALDEGGGALDALMSYHSRRPERRRIYLNAAMGRAPGLDVDRALARANEPVLGKDAYAAASGGKARNAGRPGKPGGTGRHGQAVRAGKGVQAGQSGRDGRGVRPAQPGQAGRSGQLARSGQAAGKGQRGRQGNGVRRIEIWTPKETRNTAQPDPLVASLARLPGTGAGGSWISYPRQLVPPERKGGDVLARADGEGGGAHGGHARKAGRDPSRGSGMGASGAVPSRGSGMGASGAVPSRGSGMAASGGPAEAPASGDAADPGAGLRPDAGRPAVAPGQAR
jgi:hypothetical protein